MSDLKPFLEKSSFPGFVKLSPPLILNLEAAAHLFQGERKMGKLDRTPGNVGRGVGPRLRSTASTQPPPDSSDLGVFISLGRVWGPGREGIRSGPKAGGVARGRGPGFTPAVERNPTHFSLRVLTFQSENMQETKLQFFT